MEGDIGETIIRAADFIWGTPILILLLGGGFFFLVYSRLVPLRYTGHALSILTGKYDHPDEPGQLKHYQALSTALAGTIGMGNISGVAVAIATGGPGAMFWMWISALLGVSTKYFECTLAVMFRGRDSNGEIQGGPMYFITEGLGKKWKPMALFFSVAGLIGVSPFSRPTSSPRSSAMCWWCPTGRIPRNMSASSLAFFWPLPRERSSSEGYGASAVSPVR